MLTAEQDFTSTELGPVEGQKTPFVSSGAQACLLFSVLLPGQLAAPVGRWKVGRKCSFSGDPRSLEELMQKDCCGRSHCIVVCIFHSAYFFTLHIIIISNTNWINYLAVCPNLSLIH